MRSLQNSKVNTRDQFTFGASGAGGCVFDLFMDSLDLDGIDFGLHFFEDAFYTNQRETGVENQ
jgi:hypothetical protein